MPIAQVLLALRSLADVIIVGAGTVRIEGYGPPKKPGQRIGVVSRTRRRRPVDAAVHQRCGLPDRAPTRHPHVPIDTIRAGDDELDLVAALGQLDADFVQAEGGPSLNAALAAADVIDELNLTISPVLSGGDGPRLLTGAAADRSPTGSWPTSWRTTGSCSPATCVGADRSTSTGRSIAPRRSRRRSDQPSEASRRPRDEDVTRDELPRRRIDPQFEHRRAGDGVGIEARRLSRSRSTRSRLVDVRSPRPRGRRACPRRRRPTDRRPASAASPADRAARRPACANPASCR